MDRARTTDIVGFWAFGYYLCAFVRPAGVPWIYTPLLNILRRCHIRLPRSLLYQGKTELRPFPTSSILSHPIPTYLHILSPSHPNASQPITSFLSLLPSLSCHPKNIPIHIANPVSKSIPIQLQRVHIQSRAGTQVPEPLHDFNKPANPFLP